VSRANSPTGEDFIDRMRKIRQAAEVWCPEGTYPRRVGLHQQSRADISSLVNHLASRVHDDGFVSVYGFPRGHSSDGSVPDVDTLMLDFDVPGDQYAGDGDMDDWTSEMYDLLARVRLVVEYLADKGKVDHWRFSLSGHKGVHLYLDFDTVHPDMGNLSQFKTGLSAYTSEMITYLESEIGVTLQPWLDVDSSDMGRLTRLPNTIHTGATTVFGTERFCVPVTANELRDLTVADYWALTSSPREVPAGVRRIESERASKAVARHIQHASASSSGTHSGSYNSERVEEYKNNANDGYESVDDLWLFLEDRPCIKAYYERDGDQFHYGNASHTMELFVMARFVNMGVPYEIIVEFFETMDADGFDAHETRGRLNEIIARNYNEFNCEKVWQEAPRFCLEDGCHIYERSH
jgi:mRNA-degrading endonuclease toxin of MazEF toxin-antitoxin module